MKCAFIATLYNEEGNLDRWWECLRQQTVQPDEIVIVDGGSTDGTWEKLQTLVAPSPVSVKLEQRRCNIAAGRNRAIQLTDAEIIAVNDAGSFPDQHWFGEITRPLIENKKIDVVGGRSLTTGENKLQRLILQLESQPVKPAVAEEILPSSRNIAFRRQAWTDVGGYPEWLTLTAEDALFNFELHKIGKRFAYNPAAAVTWPVRDSARAYFKMLFSYGYGSAEARLYTKNYLRNWAITLCPPALLLSRHRFRHLKFRYKKNAFGALGWLAGKLKGHRAPTTWRRLNDTWLSPEAQVSLNKLLCQN